MITKKMNIGNRNTYDIIIIDGISDINGNVAILKNNLPHDPEPYVVALGYDIDNGTWKNGWYYETLEEAKKAFYRHTIGL